MHGPVNFTDSDLESLLGCPRSDCRLHIQMFLTVFLKDFCQCYDFVLLAFFSCHSQLTSHKLCVISFTVVSLASTLRWSVKTSIFVIFYSSISVKERTQHRLLKRYAMCMARKPQKTESVEIGLINSVMGIFTQR